MLGTGAVERMKRASEAMIVKGKEDVEKSRTLLKEAIAAGQEASQTEKKPLNAEANVSTPKLAHKTSERKTFDGELKALKALVGKKCLRCNSVEIKTLLGKANILGTGLALTFPILILFGAGKRSKNLNVCKDCGFSWEDR